MPGEPFHHLTHTHSAPQSSHLSTGGTHLAPSLPCACLQVHFFVHLYFVSRRQLKLFVAGMWTTVVDLALCYCIGLLLALIFGQIEPGGREGNLLQQFATVR